MLGVGLGVSAGLVFDGNRYQDPLGLDAPLVNQSCTANDSVLVLVSTDAPDRLSAELATHDDARYLQTAQSCDTAWREAGRPAQAYVAYLGPASTRAACEMQMTGNYRGAHVTELTASTTDTVQCLCHVPRQGMPTLMTGMEVTDREIVYIHALQHMLTTLGRRPDEPTTNSYDPRTVSQVKRFQQFAGRAATGAVDQDTWQALQRGCD